MNTDSSIRNLLQECFAGVWGTNPNANGGVAVLRSTNFGEEGKLDLSSVVIRHIDASVLAEKKLRTGDTLLEKSGGGPQQPVGRVVFFDATFEAVCSNFIQVCRPKEANDSRFIFYLLDHLYRAGVMHKFQQQTTGLINLKLEEFLDLTIHRPTKNQQEAVARVLSVVDLAIAETEALLVKRQRIKTGLMHDLLTRGLDARGRLRDVSSGTFKRSVFGPIPESWDVKPLGQCTQLPITYGIVQAGPHVPGGVPYIRTGDMDGDELIRESMLCTSAELASRFRRSEVRAGEIVCAIRATVGKVLPVPESLDGANLTQGTARISPNSSTHGRFLLWSLRAYRTQQEISLQSKGTTFSEITLTDLRKTPVVMPRDFKEQVDIAKIIDESDEALRKTRASLGKLKRTKSGLMHDLLSGRVPVTPLLSNSPTLT